jgi:GT2 family glycosyltransferase
MTQTLPDPRRAKSQRVVLPILVLYNCSLENSATYQTLVASSIHGGMDPVLLAIYDNSETPQVKSSEEALLLAYKHDSTNSGLAAAYNWALEIAELRGFSWLLLLDQDTRLPSTFLESLLGVVNLYDTNQSVAAIVPFVKDGLAEISPRRVRFGRLTPLPKQSPSVTKCEVTAINSGAAIRVSFVQSLGGFNPNYRLDWLDHWLFRQLYAQGKRVALTNSVLEHALSVSDYRNHVSLSRYRSVLSSEILFMTTEKRRVEFGVYVFRLLLRSVKQLVIYRRPELAAVTSSAIASIFIRPPQEGSQAKD